jgi:hypothetical protein
VYVKLQVTPTMCKVVTVHDLKHENLIYSRKGKRVITDIIDLIHDPNNNNLVIPLHFGIANAMPTLVKNMLYEESFIMVINTYDKQHTDWYESRAFSAILMVVALVLSGTSSVVETYNKYVATEMQLELEDLESDYALLQSELEEVNDQLGMKADYDPLLWNKNTTSTEITGERPNLFLARTSNTGNTSILKIVENYTDMLLRLPAMEPDPFYNIS